ncbi:nucleotidyltransferase family protein [Fictibacillus norfolkensis]|uniref:Nucleotidyltransferase family protein n=1 Tax=Fictibacillus norfolkensis TaxID=2762233 RepID=A0ABR8SKG5_9BACL|nr:nucleotidyltransferase family protein [Fictibacillus norfolkensis]MBD7963614.1 nucleotidyltransferase family protein [Fictibacillus norfolkensis]
MKKVDQHQYIINLIKNDEWMMRVLRAAKTLELPDWWVCAGFVRSKVWDTLHDFQERTRLADIDVVYFNPDDLNKESEKKYESMLHEQISGLPWSVKNEARMHLVNDDFEPYTSTVDAISKFPETVTALGVRLNEQGEVILAAPCGIEDVLSMEVRPTDSYRRTEDRRNKYKERVKKKNWNAVWFKVRVVE